MLETRIIYLVDQLEWDITMFVQPKKQDPTMLCICVDFLGLNKVMLTDPFPTPFSNEIIIEVAGYGCCSFTYNFSVYNQVPISKEDQQKTTLFCEFRSFAYKVMHFCLKNAPTFFSRIVVKDFQDYIYKMMVVYFNVQVFTLCFQIIYNVLNSCWNDVNISNYH